MEEENVGVDLEKLSLHSYKKCKDCFPWYMYFCAFSAQLLCTACGMTFAWFSPVIPQLQSNDTEINPLGTPLTTLQLSTLVTVPICAGGLSFLFWSKILDNFGRRSTMQLLSIISMISLLVISFAKDIYTLIIFLAINKVCISGSMISAVIYTSEISSDTTRGKTNCLLAIQVPFGLLLGYTIGSVTSIRYFTLICGIPFMLYLVLSPLLPESPCYLTSKHRNSEVMKELQKLRGKNTNIELEYQNITTLLKATTSLKQSTFLNILSHTGSRKALILSSEIFIIEVLCGMSVILTYVGVIFNSAQAGLQGNEVSILIGVTKIVSFITSLPLVDRIGRRALLLLSIIMCMFSLFFLGLYFYIMRIGSHLFDNIRWLPILFVILYIIAHSIGLGVVPTTFTTEIFPDHLRAVGVGSGFLIGYFFTAIVNFGFPLIEVYYGLHWCFWLFSIFSLIGFTCLYFTMPETKNKTFLEIQNMLSGS